MSRFIRINNTIYPAHLLNAVTIQNQGGSPAKYALNVERQICPTSNAHPANYGYTGCLNPSITLYDTYEDADTALILLLNTLNLPV